MQTFPGFEVIVTDDSPDESVEILVQQYIDLFSLRYYRNTPALGTPENWNEGIRLSKGEWIKLMHDDDWFAAPDSLQVFVDTITKKPEAGFIFCAFQNVRANEQKKLVPLSRFRFRNLLRDPVTLLSKNVIGPPSVVIHKNDRKTYYDSRLKWLVDIDFYIRYLREITPVYIERPLVNIGINELQVTNTSARVAKVEIPEHFLVLEKTGIPHLKNIMVFDAWWRLFRNLNIRNPDDIRSAGYQGPVPLLIKKMIRFQSRFSLSVLKSGIFSKTLMCLSYLANVLMNRFQN
jgi:glycosyltransferase involved in cell wall biosynthesis